LQRLLTGSFSGKALAVKRVTENQGKRTAGVDRQLWSTPESKSQAVQNLNRRGYKPLPLRRVYIPKSRNKMRPLGIPTMKDRAMQAVHLLALEPISETKADRNSYGFRPERATQDAIGQCFRILSRKTSSQWILEGDIRGCFDNINHEWLINNIPMDKKILRKWLKAGYIHKRILCPTETGCPQGGRSNYSSLRCPLIISLVLRLPVITFFHNRSPKPHFDKPQYLLIHNALSYKLHQLVMRNRIEVLRDIGIDNVSFALMKVFLYVVHRLMGAPFRSESVRVVLKAGFEYGFYHYLYSHLHYSVLNYRNSQ